ncbi:hypothetical protein HDV00_003607 [Rhizophlyctis rosea]|nr:hypothetical protein HDV00_003607 [Rhizophlyctis rosea]
MVRTDDAPCRHNTLALDFHHQTTFNYFVRLLAEKRIAARFPSGRAPSKSSPSYADLPQSDPSIEPPLSTFPGPLALPDDDLALDRKRPPQSLRSWTRDKNRNEVTKERKTVYIAPPPTIGKEVSFMTGWSPPREQKSSQVKKAKVSSVAQEPATIDLETIQNYLSAFFCPLPVNFLSPPLSFTSWDQNTKSRSTPKIALLTPPSTLTQIRTRSRPASSLYSHQLQLPDLIDGLLTSIPDDAYSITLLTQHDLFEDDDDEFICGRAYGGDRVAVVSGARYVEPPEDVDAQHEWPASHCWEFVRQTGQENDYDDDEKTKGKKRKRGITDAPYTTPALLDITTNPITPLSLAVAAYRSSNSTSTRTSNAHHTPPSFHFRLLRTLTHEILHTFGLDHCVYYACLMQGTSSIAQDGRIPPYLCPVCLEKLWRGIEGVVEEGKGDEDGKRRHEWMMRRYEMLKGVCEREGEEGGVGGCGWSAFGAWIGGRTVGWGGGGGWCVWGGVLGGGWGPRGGGGVGGVE